MNKRVLPYVMGLLLLGGCSSGGGNNPPDPDTDKDMTVTEDMDLGTDLGKDLPDPPPDGTTEDLPPNPGLPCTPGTYRCGAGLSVEICNATGTAWLYSATCTVGCTAGLCTGACTPSTKRCNAKNVETCNATGSAWTVTETCGTFCEDARCALPSLDIGANKSMNGDHLVEGDVIVRSGATLSSTSGDLTIRTRGSITVEMGGSIVVNPTGATPDGAGSCYYYSSYAGGGGGYGTPGTNGTSGYGAGPGWGSTTDAAVLAGSTGGTGGAGSGPRGGKGGGVLRLIAAKNITIDGQITANGESGGSTTSYYGGGGGGSGGGILFAAQKKVTITGAVSAVGGSGGSGGSGYSGGQGGQGRIKILSSGDRSITGTVSGVRTDGLVPPLSILSSSHPTQDLYYNDDSPGLAMAWDQAFAGRQGYYWDVNSAGSRPPTPANGGKVVATEMVTVPVSSLKSGANYFHIVPIDAMSNVGTVENMFKVNINTAPPSIRSTSHPTQSTWYPSLDVFFEWSYPQDDKNFKGAYYVLDHYGETRPEASTATLLPLPQKQLLRSGLTAGVWVMHMVPVDQRGYLTKAAQHFRVFLGTDPGKGGLLGQVVDGTGKPISGATITVNRGLWTAGTNSAGSYNFGATIPAMNWEVRAISPDGTLTETKMDTVTSGGTTTVNFTLK